MADPNYPYTVDEIKKNLLLLENHGKNNPCPECMKKHLMLVEGLSEEGALMIEEDDKKIEFLDMADWARNSRKRLEQIG
jgi:hypothetical protein